MVIYVVLAGFSNVLFTYQVNIQVIQYPCGFAEDFLWLFYHTLKVFLT